MYKCNTLAALVAVALLAATGVASAQVQVKGGGASLPATLYKGSADSILPANFSYAVTGSGTGKKAFLENNASLFSTTGTVHFAGSDSILSGTEISTYNTNYNTAGGANYYGPLIQVPSVATSVTVPFNKAGGDLNLDVAAICGVFSGKFTDWSQVVGSGRSGAITVVYRGESSGTSELLTRFLATACSTGDVSGTTLKQTNGAPQFSTQSTFAKLFVNDQAPANFIPAPATGGSSLYNAVYAADGRIGYVGPDSIPASELNNATRIAKVKGYAPTEVNVQATLETVAPPTGAAANEPANWVPVFGNPSAGYPIAGYTNLIIGQCYKDATVAGDILDFMGKHYSTDAAYNTETEVRDHGFIPLTPAWRDAIVAHFLDDALASGINNVNTCAGIGRP